MKKRSDGFFVRHIVKKMMEDMVDVRYSLSIERQGYPITLLCDGADENLSVLERDLVIRTYAADKNIQVGRECPLRVEHILMPLLPHRY